MTMPESASMRTKEGKIKKPSESREENQESESNIPNQGTAFIPNIMFDKEHLTNEEAITLINNLSGALLLDARIRQGKRKHCKHL